MESWELSSIKAFLLSVEDRPFASHKDDFGFVKEAFEKNEIQILEVLSLPKVEKAFVVLSGSDLVGLEEAISKELSNIKKIVLFITSDECGDFDTEKIDHPDIKIWKQYPYEKHKKYFKMPIGAPMTMKKDIPEYSEKEETVFFAGQVTHQRRSELYKAIKDLGTDNYLKTNGFMQGDHRSIYYKKMSMAKIVPAPAGNASIDSFRFYEAIEMLAMPIGDIKSAVGDRFDIWKFIFNNHGPFPKTQNWNRLGVIVSEVLKEYPNNMHQVVAWWIKYKRDFSNIIMEQINEN